MGVVCSADIVERLAADPDCQRGARVRSAGPQRASAAGGFGGFGGGFVGGVGGGFGGGFGQPASAPVTVDDVMVMLRRAVAASSTVSQ